MDNIPRRTIDELKFVHEQHPDCRDVFVEGPFDSAVVTWVLRASGMEAVSVYEIATIEIPDGDILAAGRRTGNRERVVLLCEMLGSRFSKQITCLVDADFCHVSGEFVEVPALLYTDYSCMEMYFFRTDVVAKFFILCCRHAEWPVDNILRNMAHVLQELFLYRFANEDLRWEMDWLDKVPCLAISGESIVLYGDDFIFRLLNKNARTGEKDAFVTRVDSLRAQLSEDPRHQIHGHDFIHVLSWYIRQRGVTGDRARSPNIQISLALSVNYEELAREPMFATLLQRLRA